MKMPELTDSNLHGQDLELSASSLKKAKDAVDALCHQYENGLVNCLHLIDEDRAQEDKQCPIWYGQKDGKTLFYTSHYIGTCCINGIEFTIKPRFGSNILQHLLSHALHVYLPQGETYPWGKKEDYTIWMLTILWKSLLQKAISSGNIPRSYIQEKKNLKNFCGRLCIGNQIKYNMADESKFYCSYRHLTFDNLINQTVLYTYEILRRKKNIARWLHDITGHINKLYELKVVPAKDILPSSLTSIAYNKMSQCYKPFISLCRIIIEREQGLKSKPNDVLTNFSFFIDMAELWELYLLDVLKSGLMEDDIDIYSPNKTGGEYLLADHYRQVRPDIIIKKDGKVATILDAKWKNYEQLGDTDRGSTVNRDDLYQMMTYIYHYARADDKVVGLFTAPTSQGESPPDIHPLSSNPNHSIGLLNLELPKIKEESSLIQIQLKESEEAFVNHIRDILH